MLAHCARQPKPLAAGVFQPEIGSFRLCLAAEGTSAKTVRMYNQAVQWFAAAHLIPQTSRTRWEQVSGQDIQRWMVWLLDRYSDSYASNQYRALQQFFKWWASEEDLPDPMARLRQPKVSEKLIPVSPAENYRWSRRCVRAGRMRSAVMLTCGTGRSRSGARAVERGSSRSATRRPSPLTATSGSGPGMPRHTGRSCGWE
jgi:Phage integrase, N-terminal SAM-like domain